MLFPFLLWVIPVVHPVHISVTEINHSEKDKALQIMSRIFIDDLELSIQKELKDENLDILKPETGQTTDQLVSAYVLKHLKVKVDGKAQKLNYLGHEKEDLAIICYIEISNIKKLTSVEVLDDVIMETHHDQSNLVHVTYKEKLKSIRLTREKSIDVLTFETK
jgi:hypothetical protein